MSKILAAFIVLAFWAVLLFGVTAAYAFEPWNTRWWPGTTPASSPMVVKVSVSAEMTWEARDEYGWSAWRSIVGRALDTGSSDPESMGNVLNAFLSDDRRGQIVIREAGPGEMPDMRHFGVTTAFLEAKCGSGFATACVQLLSTLPVPAWYKVASMIVWPYRSQAAVVRHETFHAIARACDQYKGGCPRADTGQWESQVVCTSNPDTLMDCAGAAATVTSFDYQTFVGAYAPNTPFLQQREEEWGPEFEHPLGFFYSHNRWLNVWYGGYRDKPIILEWSDNRPIWVCRNC